MRTPLLTLAASLVLCGAAQAATLDVPGDYSTIQEAIDASSDGDVIQIAAGQHAANLLDTLGKQIHLIGAGEDTVLNSNGGRVLYIHTSEGPETRFESMTITGMDDDDSAVRLSSVAVTFTDCIFRDNTSQPYNGGGYDTPGNGAAVYGVNTSARFERCTFENNSAVGDYYVGSQGGAVKMKDSSPMFIECTFRGNSCEHLGGIGGAGRGGALYLHNGDDFLLQDCLFEGNEIESDEDGGLGAAVYIGSTSGTVTSCSFLDNQAMSGSWSSSRGGAIYTSHSTILIEFSDFSGNVSGSGAAMYVNYLAPTVADSSFCNHGEDVIEGKWIDAGGNTFTEECEPDCDGDINGDGHVGVDDLLAVIASWGDPYNVDDLLLVIGGWGPCP